MRRCVRARLFLPSSLCSRHRNGTSCDYTACRSGTDSPTSMPPRKIRARRQVPTLPSRRHCNTRKNNQYSAPNTPFYWLALIRRVFLALRRRMLAAASLSPRFALCNSRTLALIYGMCLPSCASRRAFLPALAFPAVFINSATANGFPERGPPRRRIFLLDRTPRARGVLLASLSTSRQFGLNVSAFDSPFP